ncbi:glycosyltransferase [Rubritalea spongiae]|uniref:Glycosyltransferase n=1 Tax=Rubritalea spongiae TaxID=430797 RepID=A0ABW5E123_9BACT
MYVLVSSAYPLTSPKGNTITAKRIVQLLNDAGHLAEAIHTDMPPQADAMIALHATKTLITSQRFKVCSPQGKLIIYLTGTDLYKDLPDNKPEFFEALELADYLVVSQKASLASVPSKYRPKARFVPASVLLPPEHPCPPPPENSVLLAAHLRPVKNPFLINKALTLLPQLQLHAFTLGAALDPQMAEQANHWQTIDRRFQWLNTLPYPETLSWMRQVDFTINTSHSEGGSNAVAESIALGTPVLASRIEGNLGLLEDNYLGYFEPDSPQSLADLLALALSDPDLQAQLHTQTQNLQHKFLPEKEIQGWITLFKH